MAINWKNTWRDIKQGWNDFISFDWLGKKGKQVISTAADFIDPIVSVVNPTMGSLIGGVGDYFDKDIADDALQEERAWNEKMAEDNREFQTEERVATQEYNKELLEDERRYNSDVEVAKRAQAAGRNLNSVFGNGVTSTSSGNPYSTPMPGGIANPASGVAMKLSTNDAENKLTNAQVDNTNADTRNKNYEFDWNVATQDERYKALVNGNAQSIAQTKQILNDIGISQLDASIRQAQYQWYAKLSQADYDNKMEDLNLKRNQSLDILSLIELRSEQGKYYVALTEQANAQTGLIEEQTVTESYVQDNLLTQSELNEANAGKATAEARLQQIKVDFSNATGIPIDTPQFMVDFYLYATGKQDLYYKSLKVQHDETKATWKITDWIAPASTYGYEFNPQTGQFKNKWRSSEAEYKLKDRKVTASEISAYRPY